MVRLACDLDQAGKSGVAAAENPGETPETQRPGHFLPGPLCLTGVSGTDLVGGLY
jgi:hypothetical protein